ncbi:MAG TPA: branched-chain amino acid ABC transporter substrate-binding protein [Stellaceae bacterium]|nr:branched-chain amino acid ABC transporter substrate-binding protein [Stellaceae bacterium]
MKRLAAFLIATVALTGMAVGAPKNPANPPANAPKPPAAPSAPAGAPAPSAPKEKEQELVVGVAGPMSGQFAFIGEQMKRGAQQAVDDINAKGGVLGKKLKLVAVDDGCDAQKATVVAGDLVKQKAALVVGHFCSAASIQASTVYAQAGTLQITPASTDPKLTDEAASKNWTNVFNIAGRSDAQGAVAGDYLAAKYKGKKVAVIDDKSPYGRALAEEARKAMAKKGLKEAIGDEIAQGDKDFSALIGKLKQSRIVAVYFGGYQAEAGLLVHQAQDQELKAQFIAGDALVTDEFWKASGPAGEGVLMTFRSDPRNLPAAKDVVEEFKKADYDPAGYTLFAYAALQVFAEAAGQEKSVKAADLSKALHSHKYATVVGSIAFDKKGDVVNPDYVLYIWRNGKYEEQKKGS